MSIRNYQFFCDHCGYKRFTDGTDLGDLHEVKTADIPRGVPVLDPLAPKKTFTAFGQPAHNVTGQIMPKAMKQQKRFKCPKCGYVIKARRIMFEETNEQTNKPNGSETSPPGSAFS